MKKKRKTVTLARTPGIAKPLPFRHEHASSICLFSSVQFAFIILSKYRVGYPHPEFIKSISAHENKQRKRYNRHNKKRGIKNSVTISSEARPSTSRNSQNIHIKSTLKRYKAPILHEISRIKELFKHKIRNSWFHLSG